MINRCVRDIAASILTWRSASYIARGTVSEAWGFMRIFSDFSRRRSNAGLRRRVWPTRSRNRARPILNARAYAAHVQRPNPEWLLTFQAGVRQEHEATPRRRALASANLGQLCDHSSPCSPSIRRLTDGSDYFTRTVAGSGRARWPPIPRLATKGRGSSVRRQVETHSPSPGAGRGDS